MENKKIEDKFHSRVVPNIKHEPPRVASRMEGVVKNAGIRQVKKQKKDRG